MCKAKIGTPGEYELPPTPSLSSLKRGAEERNAHTPPRIPDNSLLCRLHASHSLSEGCARDAVYVGESRQVFTV